jgi:hypothetical protein
MNWLLFRSYGILTDLSMEYNVSRICDVFNRASRLI